LHVRTLTHPFRVALMLALALALAISAVLSPLPALGAVATGKKVVVIVGPVGGGSIQTNYLNRGESVADAAEALGATVVRVFSPNATYAAARAAVNGANVIVYIGHGSGYPNPYSATMQVAWNNGWGLNKTAGIDPYDPTGHGHTIGTSMLYCGEAALEGKPKPSSVSAGQWCAGGKITPAPNFVMVYSNACYTPGAGETEHISVSSEATALARVSNFSRPMLALGGTYFATDLGSKDLVETILENPDAGWGQIYTMTSGYEPGTVKTFVHPKFSNKQAWLQKSPGPGGANSYFFAFAGDPTRTPNGGTGAPVPDLARPKITSSSPFSFQTQVSQGANVAVTFDKPVVAVDEWGLTVAPMDDPWDELDATVSWDEGSLTATLNPDDPLDADTWYVVTLSEDVEDIWGNPVGETSWSFRTGGGPNPLPASEMFAPPRTLLLQAGTYVGRRFDADGTQTAAKSGTLSAASGAPVSAFVSVPDHGGRWYLVTAGLWAGYWIQHSSATTLMAPPPPPPTPIATYTPPQTLYLPAGTYVGRKFDAYGNVTASKSYTLSSMSGAPTSVYSPQLSQPGNWYYITAGVWAGHWVQETAGMSFTPPPPPPPPVVETYDPPQTLMFQPGTYVGRKFNAAGGITASRSYTLGSASGAPTSQRSTITNQPGNWYYITAGVWAGYWIQETAATTLGSPPAPPPGTTVYNPPETLLFAPGTYTGRKFDANGNVTASKPYTLGTTSGAPTTQRAPISNQPGNWYYITAGVWSGYWVQESGGTTLAP
jgi:hypothetical protein